MVKFKIPKTVKLKTYLATVMFLVVLLIAGVSYVSSNGTVTVTVTPNSLQETASYVIWKEGSTYYAKNGTTGEIEFSGTSTSEVILNVIAKEGNSKYSIFFKNGVYYLDTMITISGSAEVTIQGESNNVVTGTVFRNTDLSQMFNFSSTGTIYLSNFAIHGNDKNTTCIGITGQPGLYHFNRLQIIGFGASGVGIDTGTKAWALEDSYFEDVKISYGGIGIKFYKPTHTLVSCYFHYLKVGLALYGNTQIEMYGGVFSHNDYDISFETPNTGVDIYHDTIQFNGVWFEESTYGIIKIPYGNATVSNLIFDSCRFHTACSSVLLNFTMPNSYITLRNNYVSADSQNRTIIRITTTHIESYHNTYSSGYTNYPWYLTENSGTAIITSGSTSVTVDHGLAGTPTIVTVTPSADLGDVWVDTLTSTQFTIHCDSAPSSNTTVYWYAEYKP